MTATSTIRRLCDVSVRRSVEPDQAFAWGTLGAGSPIGDDLLSIAGLDVVLDPAARARLSRAEVASMLAAGIRFESSLDAILSHWIADASDLTDPSLPYMLHEISEETRHQRAFLRLLDELDATTPNPLERGVAARVRAHTMKVARRERAFFCVLLLAGEEIPDHFQKLAADHPDTDPLLAAVNRYHRAEEARHLAFARLLLADSWPGAGVKQRARVRYVAPRLIGLLFDSMVHPGVYAVAGLPGFQTWRAARVTPDRTSIRQTATRPILAELLAVGAFRHARVPRGWRRLCGVDRAGRPLTPGR